MFTENDRNFYKPDLLDMHHRTRPRMMNPKYPVLSNLEGFFGEPRLNIFYEMAQHFIQHPNLLTVIFVGLPGSGKSTVRREFNRQMSDWGYVLRKSDSYEEALSEFHNPGEEITGKIWYKTNHRLLDSTVSEHREYAKERKEKKKNDPEVYEYMEIEAPGLSLHLPNNRKFKLPENRDRGVSYLHMLATVMYKYPIYIVPITGEPQGRVKAVEHRQEILSLASAHQNEEDLINAYLWTKTLLDPDLKIDSASLLRMLETMAMPQHLATIHKEFNQHKSTFLKRSLREIYNITLKVREAALGRETTERDAIILLEMLTFNSFLTHGLGINAGRVIDCFNPFRAELQKAFFNSLSNKKQQ